MESITREVLEIMIELQSTEIEADVLETILASLPVQSARLETELDEVTANLEARKNHVSELQKKYRSLEADFEANQARIKKRNIQLGAVKTNKDYQAILKEIEDIKSASSRIEDEMLQYLDDIETAASEVTEAEKLYNVRKETIDKKKREIEKDAAESNKKLAQMKVKSQELAEKLDPKLKKRYYNIKSKSGGVAIVPVNDAICRGCHLNIPPQLYNELHRENELRICPHCYRMIYVL